MSLVKKALVTCFTGSLAAANIVASKIASFTIPVIGSVSAPAGFIGVALAFLFSDLLSELYGETEAREAVNAAIISLLAVYGVVYSAILMPAAPFYSQAEAFNSIMGSGATIVTASIITLLLSQNIDVSIFHRLKKISDVRAVRNVGSTIISQAVDTVMFIGLAFIVLPMVFSGSQMTLAVAGSLAASQYSVKVLVALADTPVFYAVTEVLDR